MEAPLLRASSLAAQPAWEWECCMEGRNPAALSGSRMSAASLPLAALLAWQTRTCHGNADPCWYGVPEDIRDLCCTFGNSSCFTNEFTFERCCQGVQASSISTTDHVPPDKAHDHRSPCFEEGYSFTYGRCCESADDGFQILISD